MKKFKLILSLAILLAIGGSFLVMRPTESRMKSYYSGDAISYKNQAFIGTVNTGSFELMTIRDGEIFKQITIASNDAIAPQFVDLKFFEENGRLYVYLINGRYIYKYDISNPVIPEQKLKIKDNSWDWFYYVDIVNGNLVTIGSKGVKVWNKDYQVINAFNVIDKDNIGNSVNLSSDGTYIINTKSKIDIFNTASRAKTAELTIASNNEHRRAIVESEKNNIFYIVDDESLKAFNFNGNVVKEFRHISNVGYDVVESSNPDYLYFSDGLGVVKIRKTDFKPVDWKYTTNLSDAPGSWAMGINAVKNNGKEYLVVFNGSNVLVLDENLEKIDDFESSEEYVGPIEPLTLGLSQNQVVAGNQISVRGEGFGLNEDVEIKLGKKIILTTIKTDSFGRFKQVIDIPENIAVGATDIKATGKTSGLTYSSALKVE